MRTSSANQLVFDYQVTAPGEARSAPLEISTSAESFAAENRAASSPQLSDFRRYDPIYAATARLAGRINAASIPPEEHQALLKERQWLLDKKLADRITRRESNRLEYVRWSLDRIEDAKHGQSLEVLEDNVRRYERLLADLKALSANIQKLLPSHHE